MSSFTQQFASDVFSAYYDVSRLYAISRLNRLRAVHNANGSSVFNSTTVDDVELSVTNNRECQLLSADDVDQLADEIMSLVWANIDELFCSACDYRGFAHSRLIREFYLIDKIDSLKENPDDDDFDIDAYENDINSDDELSDVKQLILGCFKMGVIRYCRKLTDRTMRNKSSALMSADEKAQWIKGKEYQQLISSSHESTLYARKIFRLFDNWIENGSTSADSRQRKRFIRLLSIGVSCNDAAKQCAIKRRTAFRLQKQLGSVLLNSAQLKSDDDIELLLSADSYGSTESAERGLMLRKALNQLRELSNVVGGYRSKRCSAHQFDDSRTESIVVELSTGQQLISLQYRPTAEPNRINYADSQCCFTEGLFRADRIKIQENEPLAIEPPTAEPTEPTAEPTTVEPTTEPTAQTSINWFGYYRSDEFTLLDENGSIIVATKRN